MHLDQSAKYKFVYYKLGWKGKEESKMSANYTVGSMFAGIGGICLGFKQQGFNIIWANEIDKWACKTYRLNFGDSYLIEGDIQKIPAESIPKFDILTAGFPCQTFSSVGLLQGFDDPRGNLFFETARVAKAIQPRVIFLENVANLVKHDKGRTFEIIQQTLKDLGYFVTYQIMNAKEYGNIPQQRNRIYIVAFKNEKDLANFKFPEPIPLTVTAFDFYEKEKQEERYYMNGHRMWDQMMAYMDKRDRVYRFTDWGLSRGNKNYMHKVYRQPIDACGALEFYLHRYIGE